MYIESGVPNSVLEEFSTVCSDSILDINFILFLVEHSCWAPAQSKWHCAAGTGECPRSWNGTWSLRPFETPRSSWSNAWGMGWRSFWEFPKFKERQWLSGYRDNEEEIPISWDWIPCIVLVAVLILASAEPPYSLIKICKCADGILQESSQLHICFAAPWIQRKAGGKCEAIETVKPQWHQREWQVWNWLKDVERDRCAQLMPLERLMETGCSRWYPRVQRMTVVKILCHDSQ